MQYIKHLIVLAVIVLFFWAGWWWMNNHTSTLNNSSSPSSSPSISTTPTSIPAISPIAPKTTTPGHIIPKVTPVLIPKAAQDYQNALNVYSVSGYRFQFSECRTTPGRMVVKRGQKFMLDNRDVEARTLVLGTQKYQLASYGFTIASAPQKTGEYFLTCDGGGSASILVQE